MDELIQRALRGEATTEEQERLATWRVLTPENERHYQQLVRLLGAARALTRGLDSASAAPSAAELLARARAAAPAAIRRRSRMPGWVPYAIAAAALLLLGVDLAHPLRGGLPSTPAAPAEVVTGRSELATVQLGDGSVVRLAPSSRLQLAQGGDPRAVHLDGRAFFAIAHMPHHPFVVRTNAGEAKVLGTRFEIATQPRALRLVVVKGRVALSTEENSVEVHEGEESDVANGAASPPVRLVHADSLVTWVGKFLVFQSTPLRQVAAELERMYDIHVAITDAELASQTITATFTDQSATQVLAVVCQIVGARCDAQGGVVTLSPKRAR
ncbi:MAG TPA: FecR domain-containing protein [Gemmatimonadaceae bacterium]|nr:FecR domain-containing protein [Gemmatimonadaceae bacterium]